MGGAYNDEDKLASVFVVVDDVDAAVATVGAEFCEEFNNYLPRAGYKIASPPGLSIGITFILPAPKEAPKL